MKEVINTTNIPVVKYLKGAKITGARFVTKCRAGFYTVVDQNYETTHERYTENPERLINGYKKGALQSVQVQLNGSDHYVTVFARVGKKIHLIDEEILRNLTVGTINSMFYNTQLFSSAQYSAVNSKTWASMAYVMNEAK